MSGIDWPAVRGRYPAAAAKAYLDTACKGIPPPRAIEAVEAYCARARTCPGRSATEDTIELLATAETAIRAAARLIGAREDEIALVESAQGGLSAAADALRLGRGDRVVASGLEFYGTVMPFRSLAARGVELVLVPHRAGRVEAEDLAAAIDARTRAVVVSSVQEPNGFLVDLEALAAACRERGVHLVVDGAQHVGAAPLDVGAVACDFLAVPGHKWLCSPFGMGFLYVRRELLAGIEPTFRGHMTLRTPPGGWDAYLSDPARTPVDDLGFVETARKLETGGTGPFLAAAALGGALEDLLELGPDAVAARTRELAGLLLDGLTALGADVVTPLEEERRAGIVTFRTSASPEDERALVGRLLEAGVSVSLRFTAGVGGIRASPYLYNDETDVERLLAVVAAEARRRLPRGGQRAVWDNSAVVRSSEGTGRRT